MSRVIGCRKGEPGFDRFLTFGGWSEQWDVYLDGELQQHVVRADPERGEVHVNALDENGKLYTLDGKTAAREVKRGQVRVLLNGQDLS